MQKQIKSRRGLSDRFVESKQVSTPGYCVELFDLAKTNLTQNHPLVNTQSTTAKRERRLLKWVLILEIVITVGLCSFATAGLCYLFPPYHSLTPKEIKERLILENRELKAMLLLDNMNRQSYYLKGSIVRSGKNH